MTGNRDARPGTRTGGASGQQFDIRYGAHRATVVEVGGGLRQFSVDGHSLLAGYDARARCTGARGLPLIPWPNRIRDGAYPFGGSSYQVPLTEPDTHNAIHGFLRWRNWTCRHQDTEHVTMGTVLHPMMGYPFTLDVSVDYRLDNDGLTVRTTATKRGIVAGCRRRDVARAALACSLSVIAAAALSAGSGQCLAGRTSGRTFGPAVCRRRW